MFPKENRRSFPMSEPGTEVQLGVFAPNTHPLGCNASPLSTSSVPPRAYGSSHKLLGSNVSPMSSSSLTSRTWSTTSGSTNRQFQLLHLDLVSPSGASFCSSASTATPDEAARSRPRVPSPPQSKRSRKSLPNGILVQKFSLRSRSADPHPGEGRAIATNAAGTRAVAKDALVQPGELCLRLESLVKLCPCSWHPSLADGRPRPLCQRKTEEHDEHDLLDTLSRRLAAECGGAVAPALVHEACLRKRTVHFIITPSVPTENVESGQAVVGFVATRMGMRCDQRHVLAEDLGDAAQIVVISQIYVEREFRGQGLAKGTLKLLLNRRELVAVDMVTPDLEGLMFSLGFRRSSRRQLFAGQQGRGDDEPAPVLFRRRRLSRARDVENNC